MFAGITHAPESQQHTQRHQVTHQLKAKAAGSAPRSTTAIAPGKGNQHKTTPIRKPHNSAATRQHDPHTTPPREYLYA